MDGLTEVQRTAAALILAALDGDTEGAGVLLGYCGRPALAQVAWKLAQWAAQCRQEDREEARAELAAALDPAGP